MASVNQCVASGDVVSERGVMKRDGVRKLRVVARRCVRTWRYDVSCQGHIWPRDVRNWCVASTCRQDMALRGVTGRVVRARLHQGVGGGHARVFNVSSGVGGMALAYECVKAGMQECVNM